MKGPVTASGRDLHTLAGIVSDDRGEPPAEGLVPSLLSDLLGLIRCDYLVFEGHDSSQRLDWFGQAVPDVDPDGDADAPFWEHYWDSLPCSYADLTGDVRRVTKISDFYSARQWHSTGMYSDCFPEVDHSIMVCLPADPRWTAGPGRTLRLVLLRGPGPDFSERDRDLLTVLRPHLHQAYLDAERRRHPSPQAHRPAAGTAAPGRRRAHQHPDRPPPGHIRGNRAHPPGKHLPPAAGLQPDRRRHPRLRRPDRLTPADPGPGSRLRTQNPAARAARGRQSGYARRRAQTNSGRHHPERRQCARYTI